MVRDMNGLSWYINRLKKMPLPEMVWRVQQLMLTKIEGKTLMGKSIIDDQLCHKHLSETKIQTSWRLSVVQGKMMVGNDHCLFGYIDSKNRHSHDAFFEGARWPLEASDKLVYKHRPDMGDARINWELNRHYDYQVLAKNYALTMEEDYLSTLSQRFYDWVKENPFLIGISYVSEMELAIRALSWYITIELLPDVPKTQQLKDDMSTGLLNLLCHVDRHHSRFSSANNHVIVEMVVLGIIGSSYKINHWVNKAKKVVLYEMQRQNFEDGVNKEQSIHYHSFVMEAVALMLLRFRREGIEYDLTLDSILDKMAAHMADLMDCRNHIPHLGDDDGGKLFDLYGRKFNHYAYVLELCGVLLNKRYIRVDNNLYHEQLYALFGPGVPNGVKSIKERSSVVYPEGGHTILRHDDPEVLLTMDHGSLGFGSIAAHGHADALHITLRVAGVPILVDPGTYIYHGELKWRDYFRKTINHNTITIDGLDQSQMQGAFLWGKRANTSLGDYSLTPSKDMVSASHDGYGAIIHERQVIYDHPFDITINDQLICDNDSGGHDFVATYVTHKDCQVVLMSQHAVSVNNGDIQVLIEVDGESIEIEDMFMSENYGQIETTKAIRIKGVAADTYDIKNKK